MPRRPHIGHVPLRTNRPRVMSSTGTPATRARRTAKTMSGRREPVATRWTRILPTCITSASLRLLPQRSLSTSSAARTNATSWSLSRLGSRSLRRDSGRGGARHTFRSVRTATGAAYGGDAERMGGHLKTGHYPGRALLVAAPEAHPRCSARLAVGLVGGDGPGRCVRRELRRRLRLQLLRQERRRVDAGIRTSAHATCRCRGERGARARSPARKATLNSQRALETLVHRDRQKRAERRRRLDRTQAGCRSTQQKPSTHEPVLHTRQPLTLQSAPASGSQARRFPLLHTLRKRCSIRGERSVDRCRTSSAGGGVDAGISAAHLYTVMRSVSLHPMTGD
jgi:hypothetical protein